MLEPASKNKRTNKAMSSLFLPVLGVEGDGNGGGGDCASGDEGTGGGVVGIDGKAEGKESVC